MKTIFSLITLVPFLFLIGCSSLFTDNAVTTIIEEGGKITTTISGTVAQRDQIYADERKYRDDKTAKMFEKSGVNIEYARVELSDGSMAWLPEKMSVRAPHRYQQNIESRPPDHRAWGTVDKGLDVADSALKLFQLNEILGTASDSAGTDYRGDYVTNMDSYNSTSSTSSEVVP